jgi:hypothetical protein
MSTRSTTHFIETDPSSGEIYTAAIIYRHSDGYPKGAGKDLFKFISRCKKLADSRLTDPSYLAARYVVFLGELFATDYAFEDSTGKRHKHAYNPKNPKEKLKYVTIPKKNRLDFISCGVVMQDPLDIEYRYVVDCGKIDKTGRPEVKCFKVNIGDDGRDISCVEVPIPGRTKAAPIVEKWETISTVPSRTNHRKSYTIERNNITMALRCSCPDYQYRAHKTGPCKHIHSLPVSARYAVAGAV